MKVLGIITIALIVIGGLNWGLVGFLRFDLVAAVFGEMSSVARLVYALVGISAIYQLLRIKNVAEAQ